ncbi:MAG: acyl carrier protein [Nostoc sp.]|uniref:acyl carrier protein n=1 Tax=Nostoc sp. TaxID=1180 RepID=UPI002FF2D7F1
MEKQNIQSNQMPTVSASNEGNRKFITARDIQLWLVSYIVELLEITQDEVDLTIPFDKYGLDSSAAVGMIGDLGDWLGVEVDPTLPYDYPTIKALSQKLAEEAQAKT